jgi:hypothetical protein
MKLIQVILAFALILFSVGLFIFSQSLLQIGPDEIAAITHAEAYREQATNQLSYSELYKKTENFYQRSDELVQAAKDNSDLGQQELDRYHRLELQRNHSRILSLVTATVVLSAAVVMLARILPRRTRPPSPLRTE